MKTTINKPTNAFIGASWLAMIIGLLAYTISLWNSGMHLNEKGYYFSLLMYGLFAAVSLQKSIRDRLVGIKVTSLYFGLCWLSLGLVFLMIVVGLWNATLALSEKGFYGMAFTLSLFGSVAIQKNTRDLQADDQLEA
jgi:uncharacterized membrane protein YiaA